MRDRAIQLAGHNLAQAMMEAKREKRPWFRAQAYSYILRVSDEPARVLQLARTAAKNSGDSYQQSAVRSWEIAALAERGLMDDATSSLKDAVQLACRVGYAGSRAEALLMLFRAALSINKRAAENVCDLFQVCCDGENGHWRCVRALKEMKGMLSGEIRIRPIYHDKVRRDS